MPLTASFNRPPLTLLSHIILTSNQTPLPSIHPDKGYSNFHYTSCLLTILLLLLDFFLSHLCFHVHHLSFVDYSRHLKIWLNYLKSLLIYWLQLLFQFWYFCNFYQHDCRYFKQSAYTVHVFFSMINNGDTTFCLHKSFTDDTKLLFCFYFFILLL